MTSPLSESNRIGEIVEAFVEQFRQGQRPSVEEYAEQYPELAGELRDMLPTVALLEEAKSTGPIASEPWGGVDTGQVAKTVERLGDYHILREIGRGGMGIVYEAEQVSLGRHVALKVLPPGAALDARRVQRFRREARAAARLHHTNIVPVYDIGEAQGIHFFVMQYLPAQGLDKVISELERLRAADNSLPVADTHPGHGKSMATEVALSLLGGQPPGEHAEATESAEAKAAAESGNGQPTLRGQPATTGGDRPYWRCVARIGLQAAEALDYAHGQGMVHRDVKPANLLLDAHANVWLTDFGLAKQEDDDNLTQSGDVLGTLRYIAPETLSGESDARSDVYSLGLTLYELIGLRPARDATRRDGLLRQAREGSAAPLRKLAPRIPTDLETIVHKALQAEPQRRYQTAAEMAADLQRFLHDEPIRARRITILERAARWCRRNPAISMTCGAAAAAILVTVLVAFAMINGARNRALLLADAKSRLAEDNAQLAQREKQASERLRVALDGEAEQHRQAVGHMRDAQRARDDAEKARDDAEKARDEAEESRDDAEKARDEQERAAEQAKAVTDFLVLDMIGAASPDRNHGRQLTVREMLDRAARRVGTSFQEQPGTETAIRVAIGRSYHALGLYPDAAEQLGGALRLQQQQFGVQHLPTLATMVNLAATLFAQGKLAESRKLQEEALENLRKHFGPDHPQLLGAIGDLGVSLHSQGKYAEAQKILEDVLERKTRVLGPEDESTLSTESNLAITLDAQGKFIEAEKLYEKVVTARCRKFGELSPKTLMALGNLAVNLDRQKRHAEAEKYHRRVLAVNRQVLGPEHPDTLAVINNLAVNLDWQEKRAEAAALLEDLSASMRRLLGVDHPNTITTVNNLGMSLLNQRRYEDAGIVLSQTVDIASRSLGAEHPTTLLIMENLGQCLARQAKFLEAEATYRKVFEARRKALGAEDEKTLTAILAVATLCLRQGKYAEAQKLYEETLVIEKRVFGPEHMSTLITMNQLAGTQLLQKNFVDAYDGFSHLLEVVRRLKGRESVDALHIMYNLGATLAVQGNVAGAKDLFSEASAIQRRILGPQHPETLMVDQVLSDLKQGRLDRFGVRGEAKPAPRGPERAKTAKPPKIDKTVTIGAVGNTDKKPAPVEKSK